MDQSLASQERGIVKLIILIIVAILVLSYFRVDLREFIDSEPVQKNLDYVWELFTKLWENILAPAWRYLLVQLDNLR